MDNFIAKIFLNLYIFFKKIKQYRKKKKYIENLWNPFIQELNSKIDSIYSKQLLVSPPEIIVENSIEKARIGSKKIILPLNNIDVKENMISSESFEQVFQAMNRSRTSKFRGHLTTELKKSLDYVVESEIGWDLTKLNMNLNFDAELLPDLSDQIESIELIEDLYFAQELVPTLELVVNEYEDKKPDSRTQNQTKNIFIKKYNEVQNNNRGIIFEINQNMMEFLESGLRGLITSIKKNYPKICHDWHIFFWGKKSILATAEVKDFYHGKFDELWNKYNKDLLRIERKSGQDSYDILNAWAKGLGAKSRPKSRKRGEPLDMTLIKLNNFRILPFPISEKNCKKLIGRPFHSFALITQKQVKSLLQAS